MRFLHVVDGVIANIVDAPEDWIPESGSLIEAPPEPVFVGDLYNKGVITPSPARVKVENESKSQQEAMAARAARVTILRALRDGTGDLNNRSLTQALRVIAREILANQGEDQAP